VGSRIWYIVGKGSHVVTADVVDWDGAADRAASLAGLGPEEVMKRMEVAFSDERYNGRCDLPNAVYIEEMTDDSETE
jgi:hypothetical protein